LAVPIRPEAVDPITFDLVDGHQWATGAQSNKIAALHFRGAPAFDRWRCSGSRRQGLERLRQVPAQVQSQFWVNFVDANMKLHSSQD
jgi:hypothetical protein